MDQFGVLSLGDFNVNVAGAAVGSTIGGLYGLAGLGLQARFSYGSGGTSCRAYIQTSFDQGQTWFDIACFLFVASSGVLLANLDGRIALSTPLTPGDSVLADNAILQGLLGDQLRAKVIITGVYGGSTLLSLWAVAR